MSGSDDEYFARLDAEKKEKLRAKLEQEAAEAAKEDLRKLHWHRCGKCGSSMETHLFRGVDIEVCQACGAVLLDQGELETLAGHDRSSLFSGIIDLFGGKKAH